LLLEALEEDKIVEIAKSFASTQIKSTLRMTGRKMNLETFFWFIKEVLAKPYCGWYDYDYHRKKDAEVFHLRHDLGMAVSVYLTELFRYFSESISDYIIEIEPMQDAVTILIRPQPKNTQYLQY